VSLPRPSKPPEISVHGGRAHKYTDDPKKMFACVRENIHVAGQKAGPLEACNVRMFPHAGNPDPVSTMVFSAWWQYVV
jgi:hypothetical protein